MSSDAGSSKKEQREALTELTDEFYKEEEASESTVTGHTALQSDSQAIYVSILKKLIPFLFTLWRTKRYLISEKMWRRFLLRYVGTTAAQQNV